MKKFHTQVIHTSQASCTVEGRTEGEVAQTFNSLRLQLKFVMRTTTIDPKHIDNG